MNPVIFYIDDEEHALTAFEMNAGEDWEVHTFSSPLKAIAELKAKQPWVIVSDQLMPEIKGVDLLTIASSHVPDAVRILTTAYSGEDLILQSVEKAKIFGYITKPWAEDIIENTVGQAIELYKTKKERDKHYDDLEKKNKSLIDVQRKLESSLAELKAWLPPMIYDLIVDNKQIPESGQFVGIAYDIISSSKIRDTKISGKPLKRMVASLFTQAVMKYGGFIECHASDYAFAHFGLMTCSKEACNQAMSAANEFRMSLRSLSEIADLDFEVGIAIHSGDHVKQVVNKVSLVVDDEVLIHKWYETDSAEIDLLHRLEKLVHELPGSNIIVSAAYHASLSLRYQAKFTKLGHYMARGQEHPVAIYLFKSDRVQPEDLEHFTAKHKLVLEDKAN